MINITSKKLNPSFNPSLGAGLPRTRTDMSYMGLRPTRQLKQIVEQSVNLLHAYLLSAGMPFIDLANAPWVIRSTGRCLRDVAAG
jgi:hypothetical protein